MTKFQLIAILCCLLQLAAAAANPKLEPLHRQWWDRPDGHHDHGNCTTSHPTDITLQDHEQILWASPNSTQQTAIVSMVIFPEPNARIIDMQRFSDDLVNLKCTENMSLQFQHSETFQSAQSSWDWVDEENGRSFVLITDPVKCKSGTSREPWVVHSVKYDPEQLIIYLDAVRKTWAEVAYSYTLDFGNIDASNQKRQLDQDLFSPLTLDLSSTWPESIAKGSFEFAKFEAKCVSCGTRGSLVFSGHIKGNWFEGVTELSLSATAHGIEADLNLEVDFEGSVDFTGTDIGTGQKTLLKFPLPYGLNIDGVITFGPNGRLDVGYTLETIEGQGTASTGVAAKIPEESLAKVDFVPQVKLDINSWFPEFEVQPLKFDGQASMQGSIFAEFVVSAGLTVLEKKGVSLDIGLKLPEITINATAGSVPGGFCPGSTAPLGVNFDVWLGAAVSIRAWEKTLEGDHTFSTFDPLSNDRLYHIPPLCLPFGDGGVCDSIMDPADQDWYDIEVNSADITPAQRLGRMGRRGSVLPRANSYAFQCPNHPAQIKLKGYPGPTKIRASWADHPVPIMFPSILCTYSTPADCPISKWDIETNKFPVDLWSQKNGDKGTLWTTEHVYEGNWLVRFWEDLTTQYEIPCDIVYNTFEINTARRFADDMLWGIGNTRTYTTTMTLLPLRENELKHLMFAGHQLFGGAKRDSYTAADWVCNLGRIVNVCKYMEETKTKEQMKNTLLTLNSILEEMDSSPVVQNLLAPLKNVPNGIPNNFKFSGAHKEWFTWLYNNGTANARAKLQDYAGLAKKALDFTNLPTDMQGTIESLIQGSNWDEFCSSDFSYPDVGSPEPPTCGDKTSDVNNCGICGKICSEGEVCTSGKCITPTPPPPGPGLSPLWTFRLMSTDGRSYIESPAQLYTLNPALLVADGSDTGIEANTNCVLVSDTLPSGTGPYLRQGDSFYFGWDSTGQSNVKEDECILQVFANTDCFVDTPASEVETYIDGPIRAQFPFDVLSWHVTNCVHLFRERKVGVAR